MYICNNGCRDTCCRPDLDTPDIRVLSQKVHRAGKAEHTCNACRNPIRVGDRYVSTFYLMDGKAITDKNHTACNWY